jgi:hypothetical protein
MVTHSASSSPEALEQGCQSFLGTRYPNVPNEHKMYQEMVIKYPNCLSNIPIGNKIYQHFPI